MRRISLAAEFCGFTTVYKWVEMIHSQLVLRLSVFLARLFWSLELLSSTQCKWSFSEPKTGEYNTCSHITHSDRRRIKCIKWIHKQQGSQWWQSDNYSCLHMHHLQLHQTPPTIMCNAPSHTTRCFQRKPQIRWRPAASSVPEAARHASPPPRMDGRRTRAWLRRPRPFTFTRVRLNANALCGNAIQTRSSALVVR